VNILAKLLVLSGVFNTTIFDALNYANQDYMHVNYAPIVVYTLLLVTSSQLKNISCFCLDMTAIADWSIIVQCPGLSIAQKPLHPVFLYLFWAQVSLLFSLIWAHFVCNLSMLV
jgi:hypothetical protein